MSFQFKVPSKRKYGFPNFFPIVPFYHRVDCSLFQRIKIWIFLVPAVIFKFVPQLLCVFIGWIIATIGTLGMTREQILAKPLSPWRKVLRWITARICCRGFFFFGGFYWVNVKGTRASRKDAPILVVSPHSSPADILVLVYLGAPSAVTKASVDIPIVGKLLEFTQPIYVSREEGTSRSQAVRLIESRAKSTEDWPQIYIYPEGTTTNRSCLITFHSGAFIPGMPVQPVLIRYPNKLDSVTWTFDGLSMTQFMIKSLTQLYLRCDIEFLPVYIPTPTEMQDAKLYANNVRNFISTELKIPVIEYKLGDGKTLQKMITMDQLKTKFCKLQKLRSKLKVTSIMDLDLIQRIYDDVALDKWEKSVHKFTCAMELMIPKSKLPIVQDLFLLFDPEGFGKIDIREYLIYSFALNPRITGKTIVNVLYQIYGEGLLTRQDFLEMMETIFGMGREDAIEFYQSDNQSVGLVMEKDEFFRKVHKLVDCLKLYAMESRGIFTIYPPPEFDYYVASE